MSTLFMVFPPLADRKQDRSGIRKLPFSVGIQNHFLPGKEEEASTCTPSCQAPTLRALVTQRCGIAGRAWAQYSCIRPNICRHMPAQH